MKLLGLGLALVNGFVVPSRHHVNNLKNLNSLFVAIRTEDVASEEEVDCVVIGSGLAGLSCAALLSHCGKKTVVLESHDAPGGCEYFFEESGL